MYIIIMGTWLFFFVYSDNVTLHLDGVLYLRVVEPFKVGHYKSHFHIKSKVSTG